MITNIFNTEQDLFCEICEKVVAKGLPHLTEDYVHNDLVGVVRPEFRDHYLDFHDPRVAIANEECVMKPWPTYTEYARRIEQHATEQFGQASLAIKLAKVFEESGEVAGAIIRHLEQRDDRDWTWEIADELGNLFVTLFRICSHLGLDFELTMRDGIEKFLNRTWDNIEPKDLR